MAAYEQPCSACYGAIGTGERSVARHERRGAEARLDAEVAERDAAEERSCAYGLGTHTCGECDKASHIKAAAEFESQADRLIRTAAREFGQAEIGRARVNLATLRLQAGGCDLCGDRRYLVGSSGLPGVQRVRIERDENGRGVVVPAPAPDGAV